MKIESCLKPIRPGILFLLAGLLLAGATPASAFPDYLKKYAGDPQARPELRTSCAVCHVNPQGGGPRNSFGQAFPAAGRQITPDLRRRFPDLFTTLAGEAPPVRFVDGSDAEAIVTIAGREFVINTRTKSIRELAAPPAPTLPVTARETEPAAPTNIFQASEQRLVNLPTAAPITKGVLLTDFTHRFPFGKPTNVEGLFGLDAQALPSFGITYGLTDTFHLGAYRSPGDVGRPILLFAGARILGEEKGHPLSAMVRIGLEGRDNLQRHFATSFEVTVARSVTRYAQLYLVPTVTLGDRPFTADLTTPLAGRTAVALGIGGALRLRPSLNLLAEANYRANQESRYLDSGAGIRRPVVGFGLQKESASRRHAFTLTFSNGPGTTMAQRSQTRGLYFADDSLRGLTIGFNLSRRFLK
jgi:hypothetical protein